MQFHLPILRSSRYGFYGLRFSWQRVSLEFNNTTIYSFASFFINFQEVNAIFCASFCEPRNEGNNVNFKREKEMEKYRRYSLLSSFDKFGKAKVKLTIHQAGNLIGQHLPLRWKLYSSWSRIMGITAEFYHRHRMIQRVTGRNELWQFCQKLPS